MFQGGETEFEVVDADEIVFKEPARKQKSSQKPLKAPVERVNSSSIKPPSKRSVSAMEDYRPSAANNARIYEVVIETYDFNKSGTKINYSHTIKYPGHKEFFDED